MPSPHPFTGAVARFAGKVSGDRSRTSETQDVRCNWLFGTPHPCGGFGSHSGEGAHVTIEINFKVDDISKY
jgi:hypothetical protein